MGHDGDRVPRLVAAQRHAVGVQQPLHLCGHGVEDRGGHGTFCDQRRHSSQCRLLVGDAAIVGIQLRVVQGDGELSGDQLDRVQPLGRERVAYETVLEYQQCLQHAAADDRDGQHRAGAEAGEVGVAGEAIVADGIAHDQRFARPLDVSQHGHRDRWFVGAVSRDGTAGAARREQPVLPRVAPQQQVDAGGAGHRAEHLDHPSVQPFDVRLRAERLGGGQDPEQVDRPGRDGRPVEKGLAGSVIAPGWSRRGGCAQSIWPTFAVAPQARYWRRASARRSWPACSTPWARWKRAARSAIRAACQGR